MCSKLSRRVMSLGAWLVSAPQMKLKSSNGLRRQDRSATPNLHDCVPGLCSAGALETGETPSRVCLILNFPTNGKAGNCEEETDTPTDSH